MRERESSDAHNSHITNIQNSQKHVLKNCFGDAFFFFFFKSSLLGFVIKLRHVAHVEQSGPKRDVETRHNGHSTKHKRLGCVLFYTGNSFLGVLNFLGDFFPVPGFSEMVFRDTASNFSLVMSLK